MWDSYAYMFIPEAMYSGLSHPGMVLISDDLLSSSGGAPQEFRKQWVLMSQMAQQWFGNFVTMSWWNDLWISKSISAYFAYLSLAKTGNFADIDGYYMTSMTQAQQADTMSCTHPLAGFTNDTDNVEIISEDIISVKGAAVMKQLSFLLGEAKFRKCVQNFLNLNCWGNASLPQFLIAFTNSVDLQPWAESWLNQAGLNELSVSINENKAGKVGDVEITQKSVTPGHPALRQHNITIQLFGTDGKVTKTANATIQAASKTCLTDLRNLPMPNWVVLNGENQSYCRTTFDKTSRSYIALNYRLIQNALTPVTRQKIWKNLLENVLNCQITIWEFVDLVADSLPLETNVGVLQQLVIDVKTALDLAPICNQKDERYSRFFALFLPKLTGAMPETDIEFMKWAVFQFAVTESDIKQCVEWVKLGYI